MATRVFDGMNFCEHFLKRTSQGTFLPSLVQIGRAVCEERFIKEIVEDAGVKFLSQIYSHLQTLSVLTGPKFKIFVAR